jgi:hypothetical protein
MAASTRLLATRALASACAALALPSAASAARSGVTIHLFVGDSLKGFVFSRKPRKCADGRTVNLSRQKGKKQNPKRDIKVAKTQAARRSNGKYRWELTLHRPRPGGRWNCALPLSLQARRSAVSALPGLPEGLQARQPWRARLQGLRHR